MSAGAFQTNLSAAQYRRVAWPLVLALATSALLFSTLFYNSPFCPAGKLMGGPYLGLGIACGAFGAFLGMLTLGLIQFFQKELPIIRPQQGSIMNTSWMTVVVCRWIGGALLALSLLGWANAALSYYCISSHSIFIRPSAFAESTRYAWTDVAEVTAGCRQSRSGTYGFFTLHLKDGRVLALAGWENYLAEINGALAAVPFVYNDSQVAGCPSPYREMLTRRPGA